MNQCEYPGRHVSRNMEKIISSNTEWLDMDIINFNRLLDHIYSIWESAVILQKSGNNSIPIFLAITAIEEKANDIQENDCQYNI